MPHAPPHVALMHAPGEDHAVQVADHGDVIAISGAVPYSWGFGSPIV